MSGEVRPAGATAGDERSGEPYRQLPPLSRAGARCRRRRVVEVEAERKGVGEAAEEAGEPL